VQNSKGGADWRVCDRGESDAEVCVLERREIYLKGREEVCQAMEGASMQDDGASKYARQGHKRYSHQRREVKRETMEKDDGERRWREDERDEEGDNVEEKREMKREKKREDKRELKRETMERRSM